MTMIDSKYSGYAFASIWSNSKTTRGFLSYSLSPPTPTNSSVSAHVYNKDCSTQSGGAPWKFNQSGPSDSTNQMSFVSIAMPGSPEECYGFSIVSLNKYFAMMDNDTRAASIVLMDPNSNKLVCLNLVRNFVLEPPVSLPPVAPISESPLTMPPGAPPQDNLQGELVASILTPLLFGLILLISVILFYKNVGGIRTKFETKKSPQQTPGEVPSGKDAPAERRFTTKAPADHDDRRYTAKAPAETHPPDAIEL
jgi:hypothetical protein